MKATATTTTLGNNRGTLGRRLARAFFGAVTVTAVIAFGAMLAAYPTDFALWEQVGTMTKLTDLGCLAVLAVVVAGLASLYPWCARVDAARELERVSS